MKRIFLAPKASITVAKLGRPKKHLIMFDDRINLSDNIDVKIT